MEGGKQGPGGGARPGGNEIPPSSSMLWALAMINQTGLGGGQVRLGEGVRYLPPHPCCAPLWLTKPARGGGMAREWRRCLGGRGGGFIERTSTAIERGNDTYTG